MITMKKALFIFTISAFLFSCNSKRGKTTDSEKPAITVSILPQKTFVEKIAGDDFFIQVLVPHGASPETYTLLPSQLKEISRSEAWFRLGHIEFELSWKDKVAELNRRMKVVDLSEGLDLIAGKEIHHGDHMHPGGVDPHTWLSPRLVKQMAEKIAMVLSELNPGRSSHYQANLLAFTKETDRLDEQIRELLKDHQGRSFITFHPSLSYYARDYGLIQHSLESDGKEPTPQHMAKVIDFARKENIKVIYIQSEFDQENARVFAEEIRGEIIEVRPLDPAWEENLLKMTQLFIDHF